MSYFVKIVFVQLADETGEIAVFEVLWKDVLCEFLVLDLRQHAFERGCELERRDCAPPTQQNCRLHCPIVLHSRLWVFLTSCNLVIN